MNRNIRLFLFTAGVLFLLVSCGKIDEIEIRGVDNITYKGYKDNHVEFKADINIYNPSGYKIKVKEIDMKLMVNDSYLGRLYNAEEITIMPHSEGFMTVPFRLRIANILTGIPSISRLNNQKNLKVEVDGTVKGRVGIMSRKIVIKRSANIDSLRP